MLMLQHAKLGNRAASLAALWARSGTATRNIADDALAKVVDKDLAAEAEKTGIPTITARVGQAFAGDLRSTSGVGLGDGLRSHTAKWLQIDDKTPMTTKSPMEFIAETEPIEVEGLVVASTGSEDPRLGCPVEYINLKGTSYDKPAVCKYTGNKYYSNAWRKYGIKE